MDLQFKNLVFVEVQVVAKSHVAPILKHCNGTSAAEYLVDTLLWLSLYFCTRTVVVAAPRQHRRIARVVA